VGLEQSPFSLVSTIEELLERNSRGSGLETDNVVVGIHRADHAMPLYQQLALTSPTSGGPSVGTISSQTKVMKFSLVR
jgi:hypothetical protein